MKNYITLSFTNTLTTFSAGTLFHKDHLITYEYAMLWAITEC